MMPNHGKTALGPIYKCCMTVAVETIFVDCRCAAQAPIHTETLLTNTHHSCTGVSDPDKDLTLCGSE